MNTYSELDNKTIIHPSQLRSFYKFTLNNTLMFIPDRAYRYAHHRCRYVEDFSPDMQGNRYHRVNPAGRLGYLGPCTSPPNS